MRLPGSVPSGNQQRPVFPAKPAQATIPGLEEGDDSRQIVGAANSVGGIMVRRELAAQGGANGGGGGQTVAVTINAKDAQSFRQSRVQVASDIARAVAFGLRAF